MAFKENFYYRSPLFVQNILTSLYGKYLTLERYGPAYRQRLNELIEKEGQEIDYKSEQLKRLNSFLEFSKQHSPYYRRLFDEIGLALPLDSLGQLQKIPVLEKETLRSRIDEVRTDIHAPVLSKTGGTTGTSLQVYFTKEDMQYRMAHLDYFKRTHGFNKGMRRASFTGQPLISDGQRTKVYWRFNKSLNQLLFSITQVKPDTIPLYLEQLNAFAPQSLDGIPSGMIEIARYARDHGIKCTFTPLAIFPTAEMINEEERALLEEVFRAPVYDQYASSEGAPIVAECKYRKKHLHHEMGILERDEATGEVLVTSFDTRGTPLIRYRIGDRMTFSEETCQCGLSGPIISSIDGRGRSYLYTDDQRKLFEGDLTSLVRALPNCVKRVQYIQERANEVIFLYVPDPERFSDVHEKQLHHMLSRLFGPRMLIILRSVPEIPKEISGKTLLIKQYLN